MAKSIIKPDTRLYFRGLQLCMDIPKSYIFHKDRDKYLGYFMRDYVNVYVKTSFIESELSKTHIITNVTLQNINFKQLFNIPVHEHIILSNCIDCPIDDLFYDLSRSYYSSQLITKTNQTVHLDAQNDIYEIFGYSKQSIDISLSKK